MSILARSPRSLTREEQDALLRTTLAHPRGLRDHTIHSLALGTGLREHEIAALNVAQLLAPDGRIRGQMTLLVFKRSSRHPGPQEVFLPDALRTKLVRFIEWKRERGEDLTPDSPLFLSQWGRRISLRMLRWTFHRWQERAGFDRRFGFHSLRHSSLTNAYRATRDIRLVQRLARHKSVLTTTIYAAPSDEDLIQAVRGLPCWKNGTLLTGDCRFLSLSASERGESRRSAIRGFSVFGGARRARPTQRVNARNDSKNHRGEGRGPSEPEC